MDQDEKDAAFAASADTSAPKNDGKKTVEEWAEKKKTPAWALAGSRPWCNWPIGRLVTEEQFDRGIHSTCHEAGTHESVQPLNTF